MYENTSEVNRECIVVLSEVSDWCFYFWKKERWKFDETKEIIEQGEGCFGRKFQEQNITDNPKGAVKWGMYKLKKK